MAATFNRNLARPSQGNISSTLPELPPNPIFDNPLTVDAALEQAVTAGNGTPRRTAPTDLSTSGLTSDQTSTKPKTKSNVDTTEDIIQLIMISELRDAEDAVDAAWRALAKQTESRAHAWDDAREAMGQGRMALAKDRRALESKAETLRLREAILEGRVKLVEQAKEDYAKADHDLEQNKASFELEKVAFEQEKRRLTVFEQRLQTERTRHLVWTATDDELKQVVAMALRRLAKRDLRPDHMVDILEAATSHIILPCLLEQSSPLAAYDTLDNRVVRPLLAQIFGDEAVHLPTPGQAPIGTKPQSVRPSHSLFTFRAGPTRTN